MKHTFEIYPERMDRESDHPLFFIEFSRWYAKDPLRWQLFKRNYIYSQKELEEAKASGDANDFASKLIMREAHPWNLGEGEVNEHPGVICMDTKEFLKYIVDALNEKARREDPAEFKMPEDLQGPRELLRHLDVEYQMKRLELPRGIHGLIANMLGSDKKD